MEKREKHVLIASIVGLILVLTSITYAYFAASITGLESASTISFTAGRMEIVYSEDDDNVIANNMYPRAEAWITKQITLTGYNTTDTAMGYNLGLQIISNTFLYGELTYSLTGTGSNGILIPDIENRSITQTSGFLKFGNGFFETADGDAHVYTLKIYFKDTGENQNYNQGAVFNAKIGIEESQSRIANENFNLASFDVNYNKCTESFNELFQDVLESLPNGFINDLCTDGEAYDSNNVLVGLDYILDNWIDMTPAEAESLGIITNTTYEAINKVYDDTIYENGKYTYLFVGNELKYDYDSRNPFDVNISKAPEIKNKKSNIGFLDNKTSKYNPTLLQAAPTNTNYWIVRLKPFENCDVLTEMPLSYINGYPITDMSELFSNTYCNTIDLSNIDTSNVTNMNRMFYLNHATTLNISNFNTSNVTDMKEMFSNSEATALDVSGFDTSKVTDMTSMFSGSAVTSLDLSNFNTSNVTSMKAMFSTTNITSLDLSSFDTSNVTDMSSMFNQCHATSLDLSSFDTSNVTDMGGMFNGSYATSINLSSFNTSNVTDMSYMFQSSKATSLDLSSFNTSNVTDMRAMFANSAATNINLSSFDTSNVTDMFEMFKRNNASVLDLSTFNTDKVTNMSLMFASCSTRTGYARTQTDANRFNNVSGTLINGSNPNTYIPSQLTFSVKN